MVSPLGMSSSSSDDDDGTNVFVLDTGSKNWRAGLAGDDCPSFEIPSSANPQDLNLGIDIENISTNDFNWNPDRICYSHRDSLLNEDHFVSLMGYTLDKLVERHNKYVKSVEDAFILQTEPIIPSKDIKHRLTELMMEKFCVKGYSVAPTPVLNVYSSGRITALNFESGHHITQTAVIYKGYLPEGTANRIDFGGGDLTEFLREKLSLPDKSYGFYDQAKRNLLLTRNNKFKLPDGKVITCDNSDVIEQCGELLFSDCLPPHFNNHINLNNILDLRHDNEM